MHDIELEFIREIQAFRQPVWDYGFKLLDVFDRQEFFFVLIPTLWLIQGWKTGLRFFYLLFLSSFINQLLKAFFMSPRPFHLDPTLGIIQVSGMGFPSGAAQSVILLSGLLLIEGSNRWKWPIALFYVLSVSFSRIYLGLHFPTDILGGWVVGLLLLTLDYRLRPILEKKFQAMTAMQLFLLSLIVPVCLAAGHFSKSTLSLCGVAIGMSMGLAMTYATTPASLPPAQTFKELVRRSFFAISGTFLCYQASALLFSESPSMISLFLQFWILGLWVSLAMPSFYPLVFPTRD